MTAPSPQRQFGLVDHDANLRHRLLGAYLLLTAIAVLVSAAMFLARPGELRWSEFVPPMVMSIGGVVQLALWYRRLDKIFSYMVVLTFLAMYVAGTLVNGILSPAASIPIITVIFAGYLLGKKVAWKVGIVALLYLLSLYVATRLGVAPKLPTPDAIWARVLMINVVVSTCILMIPLRGLLSGLRLLDQEKAALELSILHLEEKRSQLAKVVQDRTRQLELANSDLKAFASALSLDLRAPMSSISTHAANIDSGILTSRQKELLARIHLGIARLESDIRATLDRTAPEGAP